MKATIIYGAGDVRVETRPDPTILELSTRSERFRELWASHDVRRHYAGQKTFRHPVVGDLELHYQTLELDGDPGLGMTVYTATPGSPSEESLRLLASWAASEDAARTPAPTD